MIKFKACCVLVACALALPATVQAQCTSPLNTTNTTTNNSQANNVGVYEWHSASSSWVLADSSFSPFYENEAMQADDIWISDEQLYGGGGGGGNDDVIIQNADDSVRTHDDFMVPSSCDGPDEPHDLPRVVANAPRIDNAFVMMIWRRLSFSQPTGGVVQRPVRTIPVVVPCAGDATSRETAVWAAYKGHHGIGVLAAARNDINKTYRFKFSNGKFGVYQRSSNPDGRASHGFHERTSPKCNG